jgi:hypothetical protein
MYQNAEPLWAASDQRAMGVQHGQHKLHTGGDIAGPTPYAVTLPPIIQQHVRPGNGLMSEGECSCWMQWLSTPQTITLSSL